MSTQKIEKICVVGISKRTTNQNNQSAQDIPELWNQFIVDRIQEQIPNKIDNVIYCIYTDYENDHTRPYTAILGCQVKSLDTIPFGMIGKTFEAGTYKKHIAKGNLLKGVVFDEWVKIWNSDLNRAFTADIEVYGNKAANPENAEVEILVAIQQ